MIIYFKFSDKFEINSVTGILRLVDSLDYETKPNQYTLSVTARDGGMPFLTDTAFVYITVLDVNDNPPVITDPLTPLTNIQIYEVS